MADVIISLRPNGPFKVEGSVILKDENDQPLPVTEGQALFLCRCGGSARKPFCDGTHKRIGFVTS